MSELKQLIAGLIRGENSFEEVSRGLERFLAQSPGRAADAARLLRAARDAGLAHHLFVALNGQLGPARRPRTAAGAGRAAGDDAEATRLAGDDPDPTALAGDDPDATMLAGDPDATALAGAATGTGDPAMRRALDREPTQMGAGDEDDGFDILGDEALEAAEQAGAAATGASWPTAPPTAAPGGPVAGVDREFHEGDLLRGRFELISKLGEGGMGAVWKGKDKLKEEARDRNPFVAIKLLQGDFKAHPEAFIALQRETAKQQRLAHPNIATVYDFDRDDTTGTVFMTMEVLEGQPLDVFIRKLPADGLPEEQAMPLIVQLCNGLSYAHQAGLVHSDLKPGNCFLTREGNIKLLDFGIARASKTKGDAEGETTLFDPGQLGALTPTYATLEMFEGEDPDPRDDIYALAIMAYQLLTGKHPYGKKSAPKAKELGLVPEPVAKLGKAQNRGLARALALHREDRTPTVEAFLDSITRKKSRTGLWATGAAAVLALALAGAWGPVNRYLETQRVEELIAVLQQGGAQAIRDGLERARALGEEPFERVLADERTVATVAAFLAADDANVQPGLALIAGYPQSFQQQVKEVEAARAAIIAHYEARITADFAPAGQRYDYPGAIEDWAELDRLYPDSAQVFQLRGTLEDLKRETLAALGERYKALKEAERLVPDPQQPDIADVLEVVRAIDPEHFLLADDDLRFRFAEAAQRAIEQDRDYARARALLAASTAYAPDDPKLNGLRYDLERILTRIENEKRIAELEQRLAAAEPRLASLGDYQQVRDELLALADLSPQSALLLRLQEQLERAFGAELERLVAAGEWQRGEALLLQFARLLPIAELTRRRIALSEAQREAGFAPNLEARAPQVRERVAAVEALLAKPELTADWESRLEIPYKELIALAPLGSPQLEEVRTETARLLLGAAREARAKESFNQAREFVRKGLDFYPGLESFADEAAAIDRAEQAFLAKRAEEERRARVETLRGEFRARVEADDVQAARRTLDEIRGLGVAGDDPFLATTAPELLAGAYQRLAARQARNDDYLAAARLAEEGLALDPQLDALASALEGYRAEIARRARELRLGELFDSLQPIDVAQVRQSLGALEADFPERFEAMVQRFTGTRAEQLRAYARARDVDVARLAARAGELRALFPEAGAALAGELAGAIEPRLRQVDVTTPRTLAALERPLAAFRSLSDERHAALGAELSARALAAVRERERSDPAAAAALLRAAKAVFPGNRELAALDIVVPLEEIATGLAQLEQGRLAAAASSLAAARAKDPAHPDLAPFESRLAARRRQADELYQQHVAKAADPLGFKVKDQIRDLYRQAAAACSDCGYQERQPPKPIAGLCHPGLAGFGSRRAGQCWDTVGRQRGPMMVVVPPGNGLAAPFAISKYEVSQRDLNAFCQSTGRCQVVSGSRSRLPATGIPASVAEEYARWLSEGAGRTLGQAVVYRLPTAAEWEHAALAGGAQPERKFNCRVTSGGNIIAGHDLLDAHSGQENGWGLANYVGNAQELVRDGGGFAVRGGDFEMPLTRCEVSVSEPHSGDGDATTGFRLVRELG